MEASYASSDIIKPATVSRYECMSVNIMLLYKYSAVQYHKLNDKNGGSSLIV